MTKLSWRCMGSQAIGIALAMLAINTPALADGLETWQAVSDAELDDMRGGFLSAPGVEISFGIETSVLINGVLQTSTVFNVDDAAQALQDSASGAIVNLVQNGPGNSFPAEGLGLSSGVLTVIQNSLDNQLIQNLTTIDVAVTVLDAFRSSNFTSALNQQLIDSLQ